MRQLMPNFIPSNYLYGVDLRKFDNPSYEQMLLLKIKSAQALMRKLVHDDDMEDPTRINRVADAIKFNVELLKELSYDAPEIQTKLKALS